jgi:hypothetical protein
MFFYINMDSKLNTVDEATNDDEQVVEVLPCKAKKVDKKACSVFNGRACHIFNGLYLLTNRLNKGIA